MRKNIAIVGVPSCLGGSKTGCELGPRLLRDALFPILEQKKIRFKDYGNVTEPCICNTTGSRANCLRDIIALHKKATAFFQDNNIFQPEQFPVLLGGDHSVNYSFIREAARHKKIGLLWFDAHGDFNTPDISPSGNIHGMVLSALAGFGLNKEFGDDEPVIDQKNICIIGTRDIDPKESELLRETGVTVYSMKEVRERGLKTVIEEAIQKAGKGTEGVHVSFDLDAFDPSVAPDVSLPVPNGFLKEDIQTIGKVFRHYKDLVSIDAVELNPSKGEKATKTAQLAAELIASLIK